MKWMAPIAAVLFLFVSVARAQEPVTPAAHEDRKEHTFHGVVQKVDPVSMMITVKGEKVEGWKDAETASYAIDKDEVLRTLRIGDIITATVFEGDLTTLHDVEVAPFLNLAHVHLLLNHFPTIGFGIAFALFLIGLIGNNEDLKRTSLVVFFLIAALAIPTYLSGSAALETLCPARECPPGVSMATVRAHEDAALWGFAFIELTGFIAWLGIWQFRLISRTPTWNVVAVLVCSILAFVVIARAANIGGGIRHPEIENPSEQAAAAAGTDQGFARSLGLYVTGHTWVWPSSETLHFVGLSILFTVVLLVDLRILGVAKSLSFTALYQLLPLGMLGFGLNLVTGMVFFVAAPEQYTKNPVFYWKILFVVMGALNVLYFMLIEEPWTVGSGDDAPLTAKVMAASAIFLWIGVLFFGHMLPFLGNAF